MDRVRGILNKERVKIDQKYKETVSDLYYYAELEHYLNPDDRKKKLKYLTGKREELKKALEEIEFLLELMDQAGIDEIFKKHRREEDPAYEPSFSRA
jgi:hypothetical protein